MKVRVKTKPSGTINGQAWPEVGDTIDLPDVVVEDMSDWVEPIKTEKRPAPTKSTKQTGAGKVEKRPASDEGVETRVGPDAD